MNELKDIKVFAKTIDEAAQKQLEDIMKTDVFKTAKVRIMPDVHAGSGCVIGFTATGYNGIIPNIVGVDIGCGMLVYDLGKIEINYENLDKIIREHIPSGFNVHEEPVYVFDLSGLRLTIPSTFISRIKCSLGTLGGGNHFVEIDETENGNKYLVIHSGSRNLGVQIANYYQELAKSKMTQAIDHRAELIARLKAEGRAKDIQKELEAYKVKLNAEKKKLNTELAALYGDDMEDYLHDMRIAQTWASASRRIMADTICRYAGFTPVDMFETIHNYIADDGTIRKGSISAQQGEKLLIPLNMRDGCIIGIGKGNADWNYSAPHGAGRIMSRTQAKASISLDSFRETMEGIFTTSVSEDTIDESPFAYKDSEEILDLVRETIDIVDVVHPVYNFKAS